MKIVGMSRVKNEGRWVRRMIESIRPICERIHIFDDGSEDDTREICRSIPGVILHETPFNTTDEARDKCLLLDKVDTHGGADWIIHIDGDEVLREDETNPGIYNLACALQQTKASCLSFPILYLWDREDQIRVDGVYGDFMRESAFRYSGERFKRGPAPSFHCGNVPSQLRQNRGYVKAPLLHFGYIHKEDRLRKFVWYNEKDPNNKHEDGYRHMVIGDMYPADSKFTHGGPLQLREL